MSRNVSKTVGAVCAGTYSGEPSSGIDSRARPSRSVKLKIPAVRMVVQARFRLPTSTSSRLRIRSKQAPGVRLASSPCGCAGRCRCRVGVPSRRTAAAAGYVSAAESLACRAGRASGGGRSTASVRGRTWPCGGRKDRGIIRVRTRSKRPGVGPHHGVISDLICPWGTTEGDRPSVYQQFDC
jgi:hypothetical protein